MSAEAVADELHGILDGTQGEFVAELSPDDRLRAAKPKSLTERLQAGTESQQKTNATALIAIVIVAAIGVVIAVVAGRSKLREGREITGQTLRAVGFPAQ